jgi:3-deoxy-7-phosphoheptulonate synthase
MTYQTNDLRIKSSRVVIPPVFVQEEIPLTDNASRTVFEARRQIVDILNGADDRLVVVVGPCSIHDPIAAKEYAGLLQQSIAELSSELMIVMRVYFEKPRTIVGWKGLINDPYFDESFRISDGLRIARRLLLDLAEMGVPAGTEYLDMISPQYVADLVSWGAIGARTTESQVHRQLASGLSCPVGFKNATSGNVQIAVEAILSASHPHTFLGTSETGQSAILLTTGNPDCHIILRGGSGVTNYDAAAVASTAELMEKTGVKPRIMIDCSHANSGKDHRKQGTVCRNVAEHIAGGDRRIFGIMIESNLVAGSQKLVNGKALVYGQSITDACIDWAETEGLLRELASAVKGRRSITK